MPALRVRWGLCCRVEEGSEEPRRCSETAGVNPFILFLSAAMLCTHHRRLKMRSARRSFHVGSRLVSTILCSLRVYFLFLDVPSLGCACLWWFRLLDKCTAGPRDFATSGKVPMLPAKENASVFLPLPEFPKVWKFWRRTSFLEYRAFTTTYCTSKL